MCPHLSASERKALGKYMRWVANELGLRDWHLFLGHEPCDGDPPPVARVHPTEGRKHAVIYVCPNFRNLPADVQRQAVVHELLHCHFEPMFDTVRLDLPRHLAQAHYDSFIGNMIRLMEYGVDGVADSIAKHFPLIRWPSKRK